MKPVALVERAIRNSSKPRDTVLDCFGGSGTTMIAAERAGRRAVLLELGPAYADVLVRRWQETSGEAAVLERQDRIFDEVVVARRSRLGWRQDDDGTWIVARVTVSLHFLHPRCHRINHQT